MRRALQVVCVVLSFSATALATVTQSAMTGRVTVDDAAAAGVTVTARSTALLAPRTTSTGSEGMYWLDALPPGEYDVTFSRSGLTTLTRRVTVELARVARADARLEVNEDEDVVTSTARTIGVADTTAITTHVSEATLDRLPVRRDPRAAATLAPGGLLVDGVAVVDDALLALPSLLAEEALDQVTVIRGAVPVQYDRHAGSVITARTRSGGDRFFLSLRDTMTSEAWIGGDDRGGRGGVQHVLEAAGGGPLLRERLRFFGAAWRGDAADTGVRDLRGFELKLTSHLGAAHDLIATYIDADADSSAGDAAITLQSLRYTAAAGHRLTAQAVASRSRASGADLALSEDLLAADISYVAGRHVLSAGFSAWNAPIDDELSVFVNDRWSLARWTLNAGLRHEIGDLEGHTTPRAALTYDLHGDGRRAFAIAYGEYAPRDGEAGSLAKVASIGYATAIGVSGSARVDFMRRDDGGVDSNVLQLDARYRIFDRFEAGANYTFVDADELALPLPEQTANGWIGIELPIGRSEIGITVLQRHIESRGVRSSPTDLALRYRLPFTRTAVTLAGDIIGIFDDERALRLWARLRV